MVFVYLIVVSAAMTTPLILSYLILSHLVILKLKLIKRNLLRFFKGVEITLSKGNDTEEKKNFILNFLK